MPKGRKAVADVLEREKINKMKHALIPLSIPISELGIEEYDKHYADDLDGRREKRFVRIKSSAVNDVILDIADGSEYITYMDKPIKEGLVPEHLSAMQKKTRHRFAIRGVLGSQIAHMFGLKSSFSFMSPTHNEKVNVYSIDFVQQDKGFRTFNELGLCGEFNNSLSSIVTFFHWHIVNNKDVDFLKDADEETISKIEDQLVMSYLVRKELLFDIDFIDVNIGMVYDKENVDIINYDYEYSFDAPYGSPNNDALDYVYTHFNHVYTKFIETAKLLKVALKEVMDEYRKTHDVKKLDEMENSISQYKLTSEEVLFLYYKRLEFAIDKLIENHENRMLKIAQGSFVGPCRKYHEVYVDTADY